MLSLDPDFLRQILESLPVGLYVVTPDRRIVFWNQAAEHITGYLAQEVIGRCCSDGLLAHCGPPGTPLCGGNGCVLSCALRDREPVEAALFARHKDGRRIPLHVKSIPLHTPAGGILAIAEAFQPQVGGPEIHGATDSGLEASDGLSIPSLAATEAYLHSRLQCPGSSALYTVAIAGIHEMARQRGLEMVHAATRALVHTVADLLPMPHYLGRWRDHSLMIVIPNAVEDVFADLLAQLRAISHTLTVLWWGDRVTANVVVRGALVRDHEALAALLVRLESHAAEDC